MFERMALKKTAFQSHILHLAHYLQWFGNQMLPSTQITNHINYNGIANALFFDLCILHVEIVSFLTQNFNNFPINQRHLEQFLDLCTLYVGIAS